MGISERLPVNHRNMPSLAGMRNAGRYSHNTVGELFLLASLRGKLEVPLEDLKMMFPDRRSHYVLAKNRVISLELQRTTRDAFFKEVSGLFERINNGRWIDPTKKYPSFSVKAEKINCDETEPDANDVSHAVAKLMFKAHKCNNATGDLDEAIICYGKALKRDPHNAQTVGVMLSVARNIYGNDLKSRLRIYGTILKYDPSNGFTRTVMTALAHKQYENDLESWLEIHKTILENNPRDNCTIRVMTDFARDKYEDDLDNQMKIFGTILKYSPKDKLTLATMMILARKRYGKDLTSRLKIYGTIMEQNPGDRNAPAVMMDIAHKQYEHDLESRLEIYEVILGHNPGDKSTLAIMMDIALKKYRDDLESQLKIYDVILACDPGNERAIGAMMYLAENRYPRISREFISIMSVLERHHPIDDLSFKMSGLKGQQIVLKILSLKGDHEGIFRLTENVTEPKLLKFRSEAKRDRSWQ